MFRIVPPCLVIFALHVLSSFFPESCSPLPLIQRCVRAFSPPPMFVVSSRPALSASCVKSSCFPLHLAPYLFCFHIIFSCAVSPLSTVRLFLLFREFSAPRLCSLVALPPLLACAWALCLCTFACTLGFCSFFFSSVACDFSSSFSLVFLIQPACTVPTPPVKSFGHGTCSGLPGLRRCGHSCLPGGPVDVRQSALAVCRLIGPLVPYLGPVNCVRIPLASQCRRVAPGVFHASSDFVCSYFSSLVVRVTPAAASVPLLFPPEVVSSFARQQGPSSHPFRLLKVAWAAKIFSCSSP